MSSLVPYGDTESQTIHQSPCHTCSSRSHSSKTTRILFQFTTCIVHPRQDAFMCWRLRTAIHRARLPCDQFATNDVRNRAVSPSPALPSSHSVERGMYQILHDAPACVTSNRRPNLVDTPTQYPRSHKEKPLVRNLKTAQQSTCQLTGMYASWSYKPGLVLLAPPHRETPGCARCPCDPQPCATCVCARPESRPPLRQRRA